MVALCFWWGGKLVVRGEITLVQLLKSFFAVLFAGVGAAQVHIVSFTVQVQCLFEFRGSSIFSEISVSLNFECPSLGLPPQAFPDAAKAAGAAQRVFTLLDRKPKIESGVDKPQDLTGNIELRNITFRYPSRPDTTVFHRFNLNVPAGKTVALVGASGSGTMLPCTRPPQ